MDGTDEHGQMRGQNERAMSGVRINRLILWLSLAGMILALHLWIQKARGFDQGCLGLTAHVHAVALVEEGCKEVGMLPASHLLGVSNAAWGYAFYFGMALLSFAKILARPIVARRMQIASEVAVAVAFLYSAHLVYQMVLGHAWCVLCAGSATLVTILFALHGWLRRRDGLQPLTEPERRAELGFAVGGLFAMSGLLVGILLFVDRLGTRALDQGQTALEIRRLVGQSLPLFIDPEKLQEMRACRFESSAPELDLAKFTGPDTPYIGDPSALRVVLFVDPNCPHCAEYFPRFIRLADELKGTAGFTVLPRMLWSESTTQIAALKLAEASGKYFELWREMFERQPGPRHGMTAEQIGALFRELGLDATNLERRLAAVRPEVEAQRAAAKAGGIDHVPAVYVDGRQVWMGNQGPECLEKLVERVRAHRSKPE